MRLFTLIALAFALALPCLAQDGAAWLAVMEAAGGVGGIDISLVSSNAVAPADMDMIGTNGWLTVDANLGDPADDRLIVLCIMRRTIAISDYVEIGGVIASNIVSSSSGELCLSEIYVANVPNGTTGNILISLASPVKWMNFVAYRVTGASSTPSDTASHGGASTTINVASGGVIIGNGASATTGPAATMTGITEDYDVLTAPSVNDDVAAAGSYQAVEGETDRTVRINMGNATYDVATFIALEPSE